MLANPVSVSLVTHELKISLFSFYRVIITTQYQQRNTVVVDGKPGLIFEGITFVFALVLNSELNAFREVLLTHQSDEVDKKEGDVESDCYHYGGEDDDDDEQIVMTRKVFRATQR